MDAEIQFFMTAKDEDDFLSFVVKHVDSVESNSVVRTLIIGDCHLMLTPSVVEDLVLYLGKLEIRLGNSDLDDIERARSTFRKLRNWIKKNYFSRLAYINKRGKLTPSRVHWLGQDAKKWKQADPENHLLKLSKTSNTLFNIGF